MPYEKAAALKKEKRFRPLKPCLPIRVLLKAVSDPELKKVDFVCEKHGMEKLGKDEPALFLMNHSSFIDLKIAAAELYPRPFIIVCTSDGIVGKKNLMRALGCIPTNKFITDTALVKDLVYTVKELKSSVLMYPEASYSFDGTATPLPSSLGKLLKLLKVPVVMIKTHGAFARDPLYNMLKLRDVKVSATMEYLLSPEDIAEHSAKELSSIINEQFVFDNFRAQQQEGLLISEDFRADGLNRVLYKCPACGEEGSMLGSGTMLTCKSCGKSWQLTETGYLKADDGTDIFTHVPDWYGWERSCVRKELEENTYLLDVEVDIYMMTDMKAIYKVGEGRLKHTCEGFELNGCSGLLHYTQSPAASYSLYSDYYWYEIGDMISIGDNKAIYYCFPKNGRDVVAKTRLAAEELYKLVNKKQTSENSK